MGRALFGKLEEVLARFEELNAKLADPQIYQNQKEYQALSKERSQLEDLVETYREYKGKEKDFQESKLILSDEKDDEMREMAREEMDKLGPELEKLEKKIEILLLPKDPLDEKDVILELRAGAGGAEASIFVGNVLRMYQNYCKNLGLKVEILSLSEGDEGIKEVIASVSGDKAYSRLKYESGVHRVQRVPKTESQGRIHTSTITVAVLPKADEIDFKLDMNEVRVDVYRSSGAGGQSVNTTDSAVRVTHIPTNTVVACQDERSQHKNKERALSILRAKIYDQKIREQQDSEAATRKGMVGRGDRSERIRTYNYPQGRLTDHRIGLTLYSLEFIMEGDLDEVTAALITHNQAELLKGQIE